MRVLVAKSAYWHVSARLPTGRIFVKFDIGNFYENQSRSCKFCYNRTKISCTLHEGLDTFTSTLLTAVRNDLCPNYSANGTHCCISMAAFNIFILLTTTCRSTTIQRELCCFHGNNGYANAPRYITYIAYLVNL